MIFDVLLFSAVLATGYLGQMVLRRMGPAQRTYGVMLLVAFGLAVVALLARSNDPDDDLGALLGTIAIGGAVCLVMVPPLLRDWGRRAASADHLRLARALAELRELVQPGMGGRHERDLIDTIIAVRDGRVDDAVATLRGQRQATDHPAARRYLDERIALTYLHGRMWHEAIAHYERVLGGAGTPQLEIEMIRAYAEADRLDRAAALVDRLHGSAVAEEPAFAAMIARGELIVLAFAGQADAVAALLGKGGVLATIAPVTRAFWTGVARLHAGDRAGARGALEEARRRAGRNRRAREQTDAVLAQVDGATARALEPELAQAIARIADGARRRASTPTLPRMTRVALSDIPVTAALVAANLVVAALVAWRLGDSNDLGVLMRAGANLKPATTTSEPWRLVSSSFLHGGALHLIVNCYNLWIIGKLVEQLIGSSRMLVLYVTAAVGGMAASAWLGGTELSVGASGAVFGLLGAALAELAVHRKRYPQRWVRALIGTLVFVAIAQIGVDFFLPIIDQAAHLGGLAAGVVLGALGALSDHRAARAAWSALAVAALAALGYGAWGAATHDLATTLLELPTAPRSLGDLEVVAPTDLRLVADRKLAAPGLALDFSLERERVEPGFDVRVALDGLVEALVSDVPERGFAYARPSTRSDAGVPAPWSAREIELGADDGGGARESYRAIAFARRVGDEIWFGWLAYPTGIGRDVTPLLARMLESARPR
jgi:membrane associated rhomboid family serine protease